MQVSITVTHDESARMLAMKDADKRLLPSLARAWGSAAQEVLGRAVKGRFTGKGPFPVPQHRLGIVTNRLRKSMRASLPQVDAASGNISVTMGSNVSYFGPHEFGFRGRVQVKQHTRHAIAGVSRNDRGAVDKKLTRGQISKLKGVILIRGRSSGGTTVRQHSRRVNIPARRPLGTELDDIKTRLTFYQKIKAAMNQFLTKKS